MDFQIPPPADKHEFRGSSSRGASRQPGREALLCVSSLQLAPLAEHRALPPWAAVFSPVTQRREAPAEGQSPSKWHYPMSLQEADMGAEGADHTGLHVPHRHVCRMGTSGKTSDFQRRKPRPGEWVSCLQSRSRARSRASRAMRI